MDPVKSALLFVASFFAGALNSVLGGGSFISFPALIFAGVPPRIANATNALSLWPAGVASALGYAKDIDVPRAQIVNLAIASTIGALAGAILLLVTPESSFVQLMPFLMLGATLIFTFGKRLAVIARSFGAGHAVFGLIVQALIAVYGGYFGGGMGILMLAGFAILGMDNMHAMNGLRSILGAVINGVAMVAFVVAGAIAWEPAIIMSVGATLGGYLGAVGARRVDPKHVRVFVTILAWGMTLYFFLGATGCRTPDDRMPFGVPRKTVELGPTRLVERSGYLLEHSDVRRIPIWVVEHITAEDLHPVPKYRRPRWKADPELPPDVRAEDEDYKRLSKEQPIDRGHLAPSADFGSKDARDETFYLSNAVPQISRINRGVWRILEEKIRAWAAKRGEAWVITGAIAGAPPSGERVAVPKMVYKIVLAKRSADAPWEALAFASKNEEPAEQRPVRIEELLVAIDAIEDESGLDFFPELPGELEPALESQRGALWVD